MAHRHPSATKPEFFDRRAVRTATRRRTMDIRQHPTVQQFYAIHPQGETRDVASIDSEVLRTICLEGGADDVGFVGVDDPAIASQRADIDWLMPGTQALVSFVCRMNQENVRTPARSISNLEFHIQTDETNHVTQKIVSTLEALKILPRLRVRQAFQWSQIDLEESHGLYLINPLRWLLALARWGFIVT